MVLLKQDQTKDLTELIEKVKSGNPRATTELYQIIEAFCRKVIRRKVYNICRQDLDVLSHEITTEILLKKLRHYHSDKKFFAWLYRIIANKVVDDFRRKNGGFFGTKNRLEYSDNIAPFFEINSEQNGEVFLQEKTQLISDAIRLLSASQQELITLKYFDKKSTIEIAKLKSKSVPAITSQLFRIRAVLRRILLGGGYNDLGEK